ncbi:pentatricopeptide repeat-containing protein [Rosa sericea]
MEISAVSEKLKTLAKMGSFRVGKQLHGHVVKLGIQSLQIQILNVYVKCKAFNYAQKLFDEMPVRNVVAWNALITGFVDCSSNYESNLFLGFSYFRRMLLERGGPDDITFNGLFRGCIELKDAEIGRQLHCFALKLGFDLSCFVGSALVGLYAKFGLVEDARWAFGVFNVMRLEGVKGDEFTFSSLLRASSTWGSCEPGKQIHSTVIRQSFNIDVQVSSALVDMYAKNGNIGDARKAFDAMSIRNVVSWNTIIVGYGQHGKGIEAIKLLREMFREHLNPDEFTLASIVSSCGNVPSANELMQVHAYIVKLGFHPFSSIANSLINAYSRCGSIASASKCFNLVIEPDLVTWTSVIRAYAFHGLAKEATQIFDKMLSYGIRPNGIAFLGVLSACSHGGLVKKGLHYFKLMTNDYQVFPDSEH